MIKRIVSFCYRILTGKSSILYYIKLGIFKLKYNKIHISNSGLHAWYSTHLGLNKKGFFLSEITPNGPIYSNEILKINVNPGYPWIAKEIFADEIYKFRSPFDTGKQYIVLDIGANRGYASLYFASQPWCKKVYAFELVEETAKLAQDNIDLNSELKEKICLYNFGLGNTDGKIQVKYLKNRDGISSINDEFANNYAPEEAKNWVCKDYDIKQASTMLKKIVEDNSDCDIILKIDVEGAEYDIMQDLADNYPEIFKKVKYMLGETHCGFERFMKIIDAYNYRVVWKEEHSNGTCPFEIAKITE